ncbi:hypothetical protein [Burkholderia sp. WAC0059]|uniref:hypothetical protein n=1 Tax=Burkholderia sp. WAC0059 TaxID=2066022 RepID=UPI0011AF087A|nr:hypothetical protein [Burkholderia sp. WAC0059]
MNVLTSAWLEFAADSTEAFRFRQQKMPEKACEIRELGAFAHPRAENTRETGQVSGNDSSIPASA